MSLYSPRKNPPFRGKSLIGLVSFVLVLFAAIALPHASATLEVSQDPSINFSNRKRPRPAFVPGEALVRYQDEETAKRQLKALAVESEEGKRIPLQVERFDGAEIVSGLRMAHMAPEDTIAAIEALNKQPDVLYAEPNYIWQSDATPNDPRFREQYGLNKIGAPQAWDTMTGSSNVVIGVIDEGIDLNHQDLQANIWTNPGETAGNGVDDDNNGFIDDLHGYNFAASPRSGSIPPEDHATHVAGIAGAVGNNGIGTVGVNWNVRLMSLRALGPSGGDTADFIGAYNYAKQMRELWNSSNGLKGANIRVLNNSYGGTGFSQSVLNAIFALNQSGILFVASAGNDPEDSDANPHYPSGYVVPNVISVASTTSGDGLSPSSTFGAQSVTLGAPGSAILSTTPGNTYATFSGTSMASPHVAGGAALVLAQAQATNTNLSVQQLKGLVIFNGDLIPSLSGKTLTGRRLNVSNSLQALAENDLTPPGTVTNFHVNSQNGRNITLGWTNAGDDGASGQASLYQLSFNDGITEVLIPLKSVLPGASGSQQSLDVKVPYGHYFGRVTLREFDNVGNEGTPATLNVSIPLAEGDPYTTALGFPGGLSTGGTLLPELNFDDRYKADHPLPFAFPFFGQSFNSVTISTNGNLYFSIPPRRGNGDADDVPSSTVDLAKFKMIAGLWDDIYLGTDQRADAGVFAVQPESNRIIFRWQGVPCNSGPDGNCEFGGSPINFEIELRNDGTIKTRYGSGNTNLFPVVGIAGGEPDAYIIFSHTSPQIEKSLTNAQEATFQPRGATPTPTPTPTPFPTPAPTTYSVSGRVADANNNGVSNVTILFERSFEGTTSTSTASTDAAGNYASGDLGCQNSVKVTPSRSGFTFTPTNIAFVSTRCLSGTATADFTASGSGPTPTPTPTPGTNPLENRDFFVNQHYQDFLDRDADADGLAYWSGQLAECGTDADCIRRRRVGVSAAFFVELEFQRTGSFVYRLYKGGLARRPTYPEFNRDRAQIREGATLEADKLALALAFVQGTEFVSRYAGLTTADSFAGALINSIRDDPTSNVDLGSQRGALISRYNAGANMNQSRAFALREAIDSLAFVEAEYNAAFVLMQYFGYLQRDPDQEGYNFWLNIVNNPSVANYRSMVCAFLTSREYQERFSTIVPRSDAECANIN